MAEQDWFSRWENESGTTDEIGDLVAVIDKESENGLAPNAYKQFFRQIKVFMERSQQRRPSGMISTPPDTADTEQDYLYKDYAVILQANYDDLEIAYKKQHNACQDMENELAKRTSANIQLEHTVKAVRAQLVQKEEQEKVGQSQRNELCDQLEELKKQKKGLEETLTKDRLRHKELADGMETMVQRLMDQIKNKDSQLLSMAKQRQVMEMQMMEAHKETVSTQTELTQSNADVAQFAQLVTLLSTIPSTRNIYSKYITENTSPHALQAILNNISSLPQQQQQQLQSLQQHILQIRQAQYQQQQLQRQQQHQHQQQHQQHPQQQQHQQHPQQQQLQQLQQLQQQHQQFQRPNSSSASTSTPYDQSSSSPSVPYSSPTVAQAPNQFLFN
ncbi:hypothetical protein BCR42DRAFT_404375 [Absidia repens]|uniref:Uncharacterized protein n=1 Tax=Absidia repens TaxID=90262 RepID=A0A1X2IW34_9FUNG|nr:hypothetical protein BCR42DRAFT_404375 [Absidia repens]